MAVVNEIRRRLEVALRPALLTVVDESARHAGHAGARAQGESHFRVTIVADAFEGHGHVARQRLVYAALGDLMATDIHALALNTRTPAETRANR